MRQLVEIITAFLGTLGFSVVFRSSKKHILLISLGGAVSWATYLLSGMIIHSEPLCYFIASAAVGLYAEIFARILHTPTTNIFAVAVLPLIPGGALYYTMRYAINGEWERFLIQGDVTLKIAIAIALGIITVSTAVKLVKSFKIYGRPNDSSLQNTAKRK